MYTNPKFYNYTTVLPGGYKIGVAGLDKSARTDDIVANLSYNGTYCPGISHVTTSTQTTDKRAKLGADGKPLKDKHGNPICETFKLETPVYTTIVEFEDGTKCIMKCSEHDKPDTETAIVNAIAKRLIGEPDPVTGLVDGKGTGLKLKKIAQKAFDQTANEASQKKAKAEAKAKHEAKQKAEHEAAVERAVSKKMKEVEILVEALKRLGISVPEQTVQPKTCCQHKILNETCCDKLPDPPAEIPAEQTYVRPDKKFSEFTQEEKREYWRAQKRGAL